MRFEVFSLKWSKMADLNQPRYGPGSFISNNQKYLYAFGGEHNSIERYNIQNDLEDKWHFLKLKWPS